MPSFKQKSSALFAVVALVIYITSLFSNDSNHSITEDSTINNIKNEEGLGTIVGDAMVMAGRGSGSSENFHILPDYSNPPSITTHDLIYNDARNTVPIVIEEYNLVFFQVAKAASSEWIRFFLRLTGSDLWCKGNIHSKSLVALKHLTDYSIEEAQEIMTSPEWTRAIFVRHPKPRILSAFLDKAINKKADFIKDKCRIYAARGGTKDECVERQADFSFFLHNITTTMHDNVHWRSIYSRIDEKWWPWMNYVANMENLSEDAEHFLKSIKSKKDGSSAWDRVGRTGWGEDERDCDHLGKDPFLAKKDTRHKTDAKKKMRTYYTKELEDFVELHYAADLNNPYFRFSEIKLFDEDAEDKSLRG